MAEAPRDQNHVPSELFVSSTTGLTVPGQIIEATGRIKVDTAGGGSGTVTQIDTGTGLTGGPITTTGTIQLATNIAPIATLGSALQSIRVNAAATALEYYTPSTGTPGGLNTQVQYNNAGAFGGITGATTNGTALSLTSPVIGGATITTSTVNGVTLTTAGSATTFLNGAGGYTTPAGGGGSGGNGFAWFIS